MENKNSHPKLNKTYKRIAYSLAVSRLHYLDELLFDFRTTQYRIFKNETYHRIFWEHVIKELDSIGEAFGICYKPTKYNIFWYYHMWNLQRHLGFSVANGFIRPKISVDKSKLFVNGCMSREYATYLFKEFIKETKKFTFKVYHKEMRQKDAILFVENPNNFFFFFDEKILNWDINGCYYKFSTKYWDSVRCLSWFIHYVFNKSSKVFGTYDRFKTKRLNNRKKNQFIKNAPNFWYEFIKNELLVQIKSYKKLKKQFPRIK